MRVPGVPCLGTTGRTGTPIQQAEQSRAKERMAGFVGFGHNCINCIRKHTNKFGVSNMSTGVSACCFPHRPTLAQRWYILAKTPGLMNVI